MPSFADSIFLFVLALLLFGPKKLPVLARELGKWVGEFRRASNEFKMQMEDELRLSEQADRQKQIAAMEAAAPLPPPLEEPEHPHLPKAAVPAAADFSAEAAEPTRTIHISGKTVAASAAQAAHDAEQAQAASSATASHEAASREVVAPEAASRETLDGVRPVLPIATSGELRMMPPATGLPTPRPRNVHPLGGLLDAIPEEPTPVAHAAEPAFVEATQETVRHAD